MQNPHYSSTLQEIENLQSETVAIFKYNFYAGLWGLGILFLASFVYVLIFHRDELILAYKQGAGLTGDGSSKQEDTGEQESEGDGISRERGSALPS